MKMRNAGRICIKYVAVVIAAMVTAALFLISSQARAAFTVLHSFTNSSPCASLTLSGSTLYGTTCSDLDNNDGAIFKINTDGTGYEVLHTFTGGSDGAWPKGALTLSGSTLYGTTSAGNTGSYGEIFKINTDGTGFQVLYSFTGGNDGGRPEAALTLSGSTLYGTTSMGGGNGWYGTIFKINTDGAGFQVLYAFTGGSDGCCPEASLTLSGATLYGTAWGGGTNDWGTIFKINTDGTGFQVLYAFTGGPDGGYPCASLTLTNSTLYGTAECGGTYEWGTIFRISTDGTGFQALHSFEGSDGGYPCAPLTLSGSTLYGTTSEGGTDGYGTIFKVNTDGTNLLVLHSFTNGLDGGYPYASLTLSGSMLYGTACQGGTDGYGTIFSRDLSSAGGLWQNAIATGNGWYYLSPFGAFYTSDSTWIYHQALGWLYPLGTSTDSIWFYDPQWDGTGGWWWTSDSVFPWIYSATESEWLYYDASAAGGRWFCSSGTGCAAH